MTTILMIAIGIILLLVIFVPVGIYILKSRRAATTNSEMNLEVDLKPFEFHMKFNTKK